MGSFTCLLNSEPEEFDNKRISNLEYCLSDDEREEEIVSQLGEVDIIASIIERNDYGKK